MDWLSIDRTFGVCRFWEVVVGVGVGEAVGEAVGSAVGASVGHTCGLQTELCVDICMDRCRYVNELSSDMLLRKQKGPMEKPLNCQCRSL